ncbi:hypothetical protein [Vibrio cincinnatiensis]|uniref:hypothetical protein n=1 Tax=Vibrio cincinnatiensis TaxID=675 RepID=UPI001EDF9D32|nr:hypothetical protein [Vibrio cincinnatiensis]MCG3723950.1 hypothetical protein [Vibrio cincinnatiensis]
MQPLSLALAGKLREQFYFGYVVQALHLKAPRISTISPVALSIKWLNLPKPFTSNVVFVEFFDVASLMLKVVQDQIRL